MRRININKNSFDRDQNLMIGISQYYVDCPHNMTSTDKMPNIPVRVQRQKCLLIHWKNDRNYFNI